MLVSTWKLVTKMTEVLEPEMYFIILIHNLRQSLIVGYAPLFHDFEFLRRA